MLKEKSMNQKKPIILDLMNDGYNLEDIARIAHVNFDFVKKTLSE